MEPHNFIFKTFQSLVGTKFNKSESAFFEIGNHTIVVGCELVEIFLEELEKMGTLNQTLKNLGWKKTRNEWKPPRVVRYVEEKISMPA